MIERNYYGIPDHMRGGIDRYLDEGIEPGGFLTAVFSNQLVEALGAADLENTMQIKEYGYFLYNEVPSRGSTTPCWGSPEIVSNWVKLGGFKGLSAAH